MILASSVCRCGETAESRAGDAGPLVSLGLPVYNAERFLADCLVSLVRQTYQTCEIIVSDNASSDGTRAICEEFARRDSRVKYVCATRNRGAAWNHNRVMQLARGTFFKWCGADDMVHPRFVQACVAALLAEHDAVLAYPRTVVIDAEGAPGPRTAERLAVDSSDPVVRFRSVQNAQCVTQNQFYGVMRRDRLLRARPLGAFLAADRCLLAELALAGRFVEVPEFLMFRRQHGDNLTRTLRDELRHYDPTRRGLFAARELRVLREHLLSIARADLAWRTKLRLLGAVASWVRKRRGDLLFEARAPLVRAVRALGRVLGARTHRREAMRRAVRAPRAWR